MSSVPQTRESRGVDSRLLLGLLVVAALAIRLVLAFLVQNYVDRKEKLCVFGDTNIYWQLAGAIEHGSTYVVDQLGQPHYSLRTPGYPAFMAACRVLFGDSILPVRLVQAVLNGFSILLVVVFTARVLGEHGGDRLSAPILAAAFSAFDPYAAGMSVLALSEGPFFPLMLLGLVGLATLWTKDGESARHPWIWSVLTGLAMGLAIQTRPSWALFVPFAIAAWVLARGRSCISQAGVVVLIIAVVMTPWWIRGATIHHRFVPTALWVGASLYDGLHDGADGSSDMRFLEAPDIAALDEDAQDAELRRRSLDFVKRQPVEALRLAVVKAGRYFSPWPNADSMRSLPVAVVTTAWTIPVFILTIAGAWMLRRDFRALVLTLGPLLYFLFLHMIFVSSIRYRIPGMLPAFCCAGLALERLIALRRTRRADA